ncbi:hypothetical protein scyTo_0004594 [Scyliorhinus torazame]|uniref:Uncharacterized protein n=1 Tax=Scyliorhinus torazame TaxID=75743 RepID=A0A401NU03_SCYTO|nr:hypothetical protein [Scyliorhinus torazame]
MHSGLDLFPDHPNLMAGRGGSRAFRLTALSNKCPEPLVTCFQWTNSNAVGAGSHVLSHTHLSLRIKPRGRPALAVSNDLECGRPD